MLMITKMVGDAEWNTVKDGSKILSVRRVDATLADAVAAEMAALPEGDTTVEYTYPLGGDPFARITQWVGEYPNNKPMMVEIFTA